MTSRLSRIAGLCFRAIPARPVSTFAGIALAVVLASQSAYALTVVPPGNRNAEQPPVPGASAHRTRELGTTYEKKYQKIYNLLRTDSSLRSKIRAAAAAYGIDPIHIVGALVGEHTYNVDVYDRLQTYYVKAMAYVNDGVSFGYKGESIGQFVKRPQFAPCQKYRDSYSLWTCRENVWNSAFRGKTVGGKSWPYNRFSAVFFQPFYAGQTFGLGQIADDRMDLCLGPDIDPDRRSVQDQHLRAGKQPARQHDALRVAAGQVVDGRVRSRRDDVHGREHIARRGVRLLAVDEEPAHEFFDRGNDDVALDGLGEEQPLGQPVFRHIGDARGDGLLHGFRMNVPAVDAHGAGEVRLHAEQGERQLRAAGADQA